MVQTRMKGDMTLYVALATKIVKTEIDKSLENRQFLRGWERAKSIGVFGPTMVEGRVNRKIPIANSRQRKRTWHHEEPLSNVHSYTCMRVKKSEHGHCQSSQDDIVDEEIRCLRYGRA